MPARPAPPGLYLVATPIGAARDITLRALDLLHQADLIVAEDTRVIRKLMTLHDIDLAGRPAIAHHDHSGAGGLNRIRGALLDGKIVVYTSDAGTPMIADPGYRLVNMARDLGVAVHAAPGPSALMTALCIAGLPTDRFYFAGFLPSKPSARRSALQGIARIDATLAFFESPRRVAASLADMATELGPTREAALCRELTKKFEEVRRSALGALAEDYLKIREVLGECVILVGPPPVGAVEDADIDRALMPLLTTHRVKEAASIVADTLGVSRKIVYGRALKLKDSD